MIDVELEAPDVDADDEAPVFKRALALAVVLVTLLGVIVAYLQTVESAEEDNAAGDAARSAVLGLGNQVAGSADATADSDIVTVGELLSAEEVAAQQQLERVGLDPQQAAVAAAAATQAAAAWVAIADDPAIVGQSAEEAARVEEKDDPIFARLVQGVAADQANAHGSKADTYVAVLTVLAAALFLLGLSLTVSERVRLFLVVPGVALAVVAVGWTVAVSRREVTTIPEDAIELTAEGQRLGVLDDAAAINAFDRAIDESDQFGPAFAGRADALFRAESPQLGEADLISITAPGAAEEAIEDLDDALARGEDDNPDTLSFAGFMHAVYGDADRAVELADAAVDLAPGDATILLNLAVAQAAANEERDAMRSYRRAFNLLEDQILLGDILEVLAGARNDLSALVHERGDDVDDDMVAEISARLADFEAQLRIERGFFVCDGCLEPGEGVEPGAEATNFDFFPSGQFAGVNFDVTGAAPGTRISIVWSTRAPGSDLPFQSVVQFDALAVQPLVEGERVDSAAQLRSEGCPEPAEVRVEAYAGAQLLGSAEGEIRPNLLGNEMTLHEDPSRGVRMCIPEGFELVEEDPTDGRDFTAVSITNNETGVSVLASKVIGADEGGLSLDDRIAAADAHLESVADGRDVGEITDTNLFGKTPGGGRLFPNASAAALSDGDAVTQAAMAVDLNGVLYAVLLIGTDDPALLAEAIALVEFTDIDPAAVPNE